VRGQRHAPAAIYPGKDPVPIVQEAGWTTGPVWTGEENFAPTGIRSPDRPTCSQSLYRLRYPAHVCRLPRHKCRTQRDGGYKEEEFQELIQFQIKLYAQGTGKIEGHSSRHDR